MNKLDKYIYILILNYLNIHDLKSFLKVDLKNKEYINELLIDKSSKIITSFIKTTSYFLKNIIQYNNVHLLTFLNNQPSLKYIALYYVKNYTKENIKNLYNIKILWKKKIIDQVKLKNKLKLTDNPTAYDLFYLIKNMTLDDLCSIGW